MALRDPLLVYELTDDYSIDILAVVILDREALRQPVLATSLAAIDGHLDRGLFGGEKVVHGSRYDSGIDPRVFLFSQLTFRLR